jgi:hypothetical protein
MIFSHLYLQLMYSCCCNEWRNTRHNWWLEVRIQNVLQSASLPISNLQILYTLLMKLPKTFYPPHPNTNFGVFVLILFWHMFLFSNPLAFFKYHRCMSQTLKFSFSPHNLEI